MTSKIPKLIGHRVHVHDPANSELAPRVIYSPEGHTPPGAVDTEGTPSSPRQAATDAASALTLRRKIKVRNERLKFLALACQNLALVVLANIAINIMMKMAECSAAPPAQIATDGTPSASCGKKIFAVVSQSSFTFDWAAGAMFLAAALLLVGGYLYTSLVDLED